MMTTRLPARTGDRPAPSWVRRPSTGAGGWGLSPAGRCSSADVLTQGIVPSPSHAMPVDGPGRYRQGMATSLADPDPHAPFALAQEAAERLAELTGVPRHDIALVLGSGWGGAADLVGETVAEVPAEQVPGFRAPAVAGHGATIRSLRIADDDGERF